MRVPPILPLDDPERFPPVEQAWRQPDGLLAVGGDLSPPRLLAAYRRGIFPWFNEGEAIAWWSPDPRLVLPTASFRCHRSLRQRARRCGYTISADRAFLAVIAACARMSRAGQHGTWISTAMQQAYLRLHQLGHAHSVEVWEGTRLLGGLYGVAIGRMFFGESMFSLASDSSKLALWALCARMRSWGWPLIDCQMQTPHLIHMGALSWPRARFVDAMTVLCAQPAASGNWRALWPPFPAAELAERSSTLPGMESPTAH